LNGRNAPVEIEGEYYDGQSGATKEDSSDTSLGQSISVTANYFGVNGNVPNLRHVGRVCERVWRKWLNRRSQRAHKNWARFVDLLRDFPLPKAYVRVPLWGRPP
jgi:hypothetical protein